MREHSIGIFLLEHLYCNHENIYLEPAPVEYLYWNAVSKIYENIFIGTLESSLLEPSLLEPLLLEQLY